jgi:hypothetical protein
MALLTWRLLYAINLQFALVTWIEDFNRNNPGMFALMLVALAFAVWLIQKIWVEPAIQRREQRRQAKVAASQSKAVPSPPAIEPLLVAPRPEERDSLPSPELKPKTEKKPSNQQSDSPTTPLLADPRPFPSMNAAPTAPPPTAVIATGWRNPVDPDDEARAAEEIENDPSRWKLTKGYPPGGGKSAILYNATTPTRNWERRASLIVRRLTDTSLGIFNKGPGDACDVRISVTSGQGQIAETRHWRYLNARMAIEVPMVTSPPPFEWDLEVEVRWEDREEKNNSQRFTISKQLENRGDA